MLDCLSEPACEASDGLVFPFEDGLEGADVPLLSDRAQVLRTNAAHSSSNVFINPLGSL